MWQRIKWILRGKPVKKVIGGWCGLCGAWLENAEFTFPDYWMADNFFDLNTICPNGCKPHSKVSKGLAHSTNSGYMTTTRSIVQSWVKNHKVPVSAQNVEVLVGRLNAAKTRHCT